MPEHAVHREIQRKVGEAKEQMLVVANPNTELKCLCCGSILQRDPAGWIDRRELRDQTMRFCKDLGMDWEREVGSGSIVNLAVFGLEKEGWLEMDRRYRMRLKPARSR